MLILYLAGLALKDPPSSFAAGVMLIIFRPLKLGESSVDRAVRPWGKSTDYWSTRAELLEAIKTGFDQAGINIPDPPRDVHLYQDAAQQTIFQRRGCEYLLVWKPSRKSK